VFFIDGSADIPISPPTQAAWVPGEQSIAAYYNAVPNGVPKLKGTILGPGHNDVQGQPDCKKVPMAKQERNRISDRVRAGLNRAKER